VGGHQQRGRPSRGGCGLCFRHMPPLALAARHWPLRASYVLLASRPSWLSSTATAVQVEASDATARQVADACRLPAEADALAAIQTAAAALSDLWPDNAAAPLPHGPGVALAALGAAAQAVPQNFPGFPALAIGGAGLQPLGMPVFVPFAGGFHGLLGGGPAVDVSAAPALLAGAGLDGTTTPEAAAAVSATPFGTHAAAGIMTRLLQPGAPVDDAADGEEQAEVGDRRRRRRQRVQRE
jgi:hypothetical protein